MKVVCLRMVSPVDGRPTSESSWVKIDTEYEVLSIISTPGGPLEVQILGEDGESAAWFDSSMFMTTDPSVPPNWIVQIGDGGELALTPSRWATPSYWESFYDGDPQARSIYAEELSVILANSVENAQSASDRR